MHVDQGGGDGENEQSSKQSLGELLGGENDGSDGVKNRVMIFWKML